MEKKGPREQQPRGHKRGLIKATKLISAWPGSPLAGSFHLGASLERERKKEGEQREAKGKKGKAAAITLPPGAPRRLQRRRRRRQRGARAAARGEGDDGAFWSSETPTQLTAAKALFSAPFSPQVKAQREEEKGKPPFPLLFSVGRISAN